MTPNPYKPPTTPLANPGEPAVSLLRGARWTLLRFAPIALCEGVIGLCVLAGAFQVYLLVDQILLQHAPILRHRKDQMVLGATFPIALGLIALGVRTVQDWYRCHWKRAFGHMLVFLTLSGVGALAFDSVMPLIPIPRVAQRRGPHQP